MDSTLINIECVDEIADAAGRKAEVAAITEAAMRGEIADYKESLRQRVALLEGVPVSALEAVYAQRLQLNPGAETLVRACQRAGLKTLLVSGGFTFFTDRIRDRLQLDFTRSNVLGVADAKLTGRLVDQLWGDICDGAEKRRMLLETCARIGCMPSEAIAVGDGANDLPMMAEAGLVGGVSRQAEGARAGDGVDRVRRARPAARGWCDHEMSWRSLLIVLLLHGVRRAPSRAQQGDGAPAATEADPSTVAALCRRARLGDADSQYELAWIFSHARG